MQLTVSRVVRLALVVSTLMVGGLASALLVRSHQAEEAGKWVERTHEVITTIQAARLNSLRASLWLRNYLIAPKPDYLQRCRSTAAEAVRLMVKVEELTRDNRQQRAPTAHATSEMREMMGGILASANMAEREDFDAAKVQYADRVVSDPGKQLRLLLDQIEGTEQRLLTIRTEERESQNRMLRASVYLLLGAFGLVMMWVTWQSSKLIKKDEAQTKRLAEEALIDPLTGLMNRRAVNAALEDLVRAGQTQKAFLLFDLNGFKPINDTLGHAIGDLVLQEIGRRLREQSRQGDLTARLGGDEFLLILGEPCRRATAEGIAVRLSQTLLQPMEVAGQRLSVGAAIGVAVLGEDGTDLEAVLECADARMYEDKRMRKSNAARPVLRESAPQPTA